MALSEIPHVWEGESCSVESRLSGDAEPIVRAEGLRCVRGGRVVLDDVSLRVSPGEVLGVFGPNGAGKSTLLHLLSGLCRPQAGKVFLFDEDVTGLPMHLRARMGLAFLPQSPSAFDGLSVRHNVEAVMEIAPRLTGMTRVERSHRARELLAMFGIADRARQRASTLSGGERRRLELARLMAVRPRLALLDEPLAGLDVVAASELMEQIARVADNGGAVVLVEHHVQQALTICRRACMVVDGRVVAHGLSQELLEQGALKRTFVGDDSRGLRSGRWHSRSSSS